MTVLLVLATLILFLTIDYFLQKRSMKAMALAGAVTLPDDVALATNHLWVREEPGGITTIGIDGFLGGLTGVLREIVLPQVGAHVSPGTADFRLGHGEKSLSLASPVAGRVKEINTEVIKNPALTRNDPYRAGWLLKLSSDRPRRSAVNLVSGLQAREWLRRQVELVKDFLSVNLPGARLATLQDGGTPVDGVLQQFDQEVWRKFQETFATLGPDPEH
jgi:glycine cleavage system H protein